MADLEVDARSPGGRGAVILGISADLHDAAAALVVDGRVVAAAEEERFTRRKHDPSLPVNAIAYCLDQAGVEPGDLSQVAFHDKPLGIYERILVTHARAGPRRARALGRAVATWSRHKLWVGARIERALQGLGHPMAPLVYAEHHQSHAAAAFFPSPFPHAAILTIDGVGEWATSTIGWGSGHRIETRVEMDFPESVGLLYSTLTAHCGFAVNDGEYKLMGLAPYGEPRYADRLRDEVVTIHPDGSVHLDQRWFAYQAGDRMAHPRLDALLDGPPRHPEDPLTDREADLAASAQAVIEDVVLGMARHAHRLTDESRLCLAGGVALNCVANARLLREGPFDDIWVQPAAGDDGSALGAALWAWHHLADGPRHPAEDDAMSGCLLGPAYDHDEVAAWLRAEEVGFAEAESQAELANEVAAALAGGELVGWFQGRMEFGPRALGNRSVLADPRDASVVGRINSRVKRREGFRPFAPAVLAERAGEWFELDRRHPYMVVTAPVRGARPEPVDAATAPMEERLGRVRSPLPACTHVDGSARVQTVHASTNPVFHALLEAFEARTGCPVLLNTSFNGRDEPIVRSPADALARFTDSDLDILVLERCVIRRADLPLVS